MMYLEVIATMHLALRQSLPPSFVSSRPVFLGLLRGLKTRIFVSHPSGGPLTFAITGGIPKFAQGLSPHSSTLLLHILVVLGLGFFCRDTIDDAHKDIHLFLLVHNDLVLVHNLIGASLTIV